ncbi:nucleotidyltransferase family protein [Desulfotomaculum copahuensis]|uniref:MobA-like NTP transferase domain-containing protein n=1 Tax=Desulfotomaculum copahuensis TaxID=1838280 RepID=A0A1B7LFN5_9FIRM|nr:nucleotidyltransferase family protein [Desulfotomaculum copahuensis]OAT82944.1 hypothetical protein A6M21_08270 [Desulfotomaculum copahuensis]
MVDALVLAGSANDGPLKDCSPAPYEALISIGTRPMVEYVVDALLQARGIDRVAVVGPEAELAGRLPENVLVARPGKSLLENVQRGLRLLPGTGRVLLVSSDIPLLTPQAVEDFLAQCRDQSADLYYPVVPREAVESRFQNMRRTYVNLQEGVFTGGNIFLLNPAVVSGCLPVAQRLVDARKKPLQLCRLVGLPFLFRFLMHRVSLRDAESRVSALLGIRGVVVVSWYPEVGVDVDKPDDLDLISRLLRPA